MSSCCFFARVRERNTSVMPIIKSPRVIDIVSVYFYEDNYVPQFETQPTDCYIISPALLHLFLNVLNVFLLLVSILCDYVISVFADQLERFIVFFHLSLHSSSSSEIARRHFYPFAKNSITKQKTKKK